MEKKPFTEKMRTLIIIGVLTVGIPSATSLNPQEDEKMTERLVLADFLYYLAEKKINKTYLAAVERWVAEYLRLIE